MNIFNENYFNRRNWILENLENLHVNAKEALVLLLIDYYNEIHVMITHEIIADKLKMEVDEVEEIFLSLSDNGYLTIDMDELLIKYVGYNIMYIEDYLIVHSDEISVEFNMIFENVKTNLKKLMQIM